jgi:hypothetical protein
MSVAFRTWFFIQLITPPCDGPPSHGLARRHGSGCSQNASQNPAAGAPVEIVGDLVYRYGQSVFAECGDRRIRKVTFEEAERLAAGVGVAATAWQSTNFRVVADVPRYACWG